MNRITRRDPIQATGKAKQLFELLQTELGVVANVFHFLGVSAAKASWLRQECQQAMLVHSYNGSAQMDLYAGERYLQTIKRKIVHPGLPSNTAVSL